MDPERRAGADLKDVRPVNKTVLGRYDTRRFTFTRVTTYPSIRFTSDTMWVDETAGVVWVAFDSSVLALPLPPKP